MAAIRCIAFDFDGVLVDSNAIKRQTFFEVFEPRGVTAELVAQSIEAHATGDRRDVIAGVVAARRLEAAAADRLIEECVAEYTLLCEQRVAACAEVQGATGTLRALHAAVPLYLNSATPRDALEAVVVRRGWRSFFRAVLGRPAGKRENLQQVLARERIRPSELLFVGDRQSDRVAALEAGCEFLGIVSDETDFAGGVRLIQALPDLVRLVSESAGH